MEDSYTVELYNSEINKYIGRLMGEWHYFQKDELRMYVTEIVCIMTNIQHQKNKINL